MTTFHAFVVCKQPKRILSDITTSERRISQTKRVVNTNKEDTPFHGRSELDSHADTTVEPCRTFHAFIFCEQSKRILSDITTTERLIPQTQRVVNTNK